MADLLWFLGVEGAPRLEVVATLPLAGAPLQLRPLTIDQVFRLDIAAGGRPTGKDELGLIRWAWSASDLMPKLFAAVWPEEDPGRIKRADIAEVVAIAAFYQSFHDWEYIGERLKSDGPIPLDPDESLRPWLRASQHMGISLSYLLAMRAEAALAVLDFVAWSLTGKPRRTGNALQDAVFWDLALPSEEEKWGPLRDARLAAEAKGEN